MDAYTSKNYTVHLFHPVHLLKFGGFPPCAFNPSCVFIKILGDLPPCAIISACSAIRDCRVHKLYIEHNSRSGHATSYLREMDYTTHYYLVVLTHKIFKPIVL